MQVFWILPRGAEHPRKPALDSDPFLAKRSLKTIRGVTFLSPNGGLPEGPGAGKMLQGATWTPPLVIFGAPKSSTVEPPEIPRIHLGKSGHAISRSSSFIILSSSPLSYLLGFIYRAGC